MVKHHYRFTAENELCCLCSSFPFSNFCESDKTDNPRWSWTIHELFATLGNLFPQTSENNLTEWKYNCEIKYFLLFNKLLLLSPKIKLYLNVTMKVLSPSHKLEEEKINAFSYVIVMPKAQKFMHVSLCRAVILVMHIVVHFSAVHLNTVQCSAECLELVWICKMSLEEEGTCRASLTCTV